jgi:hypothetical protein
LISYDYSGYGRSEGIASEKEIYSDIEEVGKFATEDLGIPPQDIILYGHSLGSAPSTHLASKPEFKNIKAIIFQAPIASGIKLVSPDIDFDKIENIDVFSNLKKISDVHCPIVIVHGQKDEVVPISQSEEMAKCIKLPYEWYPKGGDHSNILIRYRSKFYQKCKFFIEYLNYYFSKRKTNLNNSSLSFEKKEDFYKNSCCGSGMSIDEHSNGKQSTSREKESFLDENNFGINSTTPNNVSPRRFKNSLASGFSYDKDGDDMFIACFSKRDSVDGENRISKGSLVFKDKNFEDQYNKYFQSEKRLKQLYN